VAVCEFRGFTRVVVRVEVVVYSRFNNFEDGIDGTDDVKMDNGAPAITLLRPFCMGKSNPKVYKGY